MLLYACPRVRLLVLESELGEGGLLVNIVVGVNDRAFCFGHVGWFVAAGRAHLDNEGFAISCVLEERDAPDAVLLLPPACGFHVGVADAVCDPRLRNDDAWRLVVVKRDGGGGVGFWVSCEPVAGCIVVEPARVASGLVDSAHDTCFDGRGRARANGDNPFERSNVCLRVRDARGMWLMSRMWIGCCVAWWRLMAMSAS